MRHLLLAGLAAATLGTAVLLPLAGPAAAQDLRPAVIVNDRAITRYELDQRVRFMAALRAPGGAAEAEKALINERLQVQEAKRLGITASEAAIQAGLTEFAARGNMDAASFTAELGRAGVDAQTFRDFVAAGVVWREVLKARVAPNISVTDRELDQVRKRALEVPKVTDVLISELIIPAPQGSEARVLARADELARTIKSEAAFAAAARRHSATQTAGNGGRLPWTPVARLPQGLGPILLAMKPGQVTQPLTIPGAVVLFYLRDTRGVQRPGVNADTVRYLSVTLPSVAEAAAVQQQADTCDMLYVAARGRQVSDQTVSASAVPGDIGARLAKLDPDESVIVNRGGAADLVMLCSRRPTLLAQVDGPDSNPPIPGLPQSSIAGGAPAVTLPEVPVADGGDGFAPPPTAGEAREAIFNRKVNDAAEALLAELRANAIIRRP